MKHIDEGKLRQLYFDKMTIIGIAEYFDICPATIYRILKKLGLHRERIRTFKDLTGQKFGRLTPLKYLRNDRFNKAIWKVRCECGREKEVNSSAMLAGLTTSCGCYKREKSSKGYAGISGAYWWKLQKAAAQRGYLFTVTMEEAWDIFLKQNRKCALSDVPIVIHLNNDQYRMQTASLDRIDSTKGYVSDNVQWVHKRVNFLKRDYPEKELIFWCRAISECCKNKFEDLELSTLVERRPLGEDIKNVET